MYGLGRMDEAPGAAQVDVIVPTEAVPARLFVGVADVAKNPAAMPAIAVVMKMEVAASMVRVTCSLGAEVKGVKTRTGAKGLPVTPCVEVKV